MNKRTEMIDQIGVKLALIGHVLNIQKHSAWFPYSTFKQESEVSNVKNEKKGISLENMKKIAKSAKIESKDFHLNPMELAEKLKISSEEAIHIINKNMRVNKSSTFEVSNSDKLILKEISGRYKGIYYCRDSDNMNRNYIAIEDFTIFNYEDKLRGCPIHQNDNLMIGDSPKGTIFCRSKRLFADIQYSNSYYPNSMYMMRIIENKKEKCIFNGLYMDVTSGNSKIIFGTPFIMFSYDNEISERKLHNTDKNYQLCKEVLSVNKDTPDRQRVIVSNDYDYDLKVQHVVNAIKNNSA